MILLKLFLFSSLKGILADELETNKTESNETDRSVVQMWRAQGDFDEDVLSVFEERGILAETEHRGVQLWRAQGVFDDDVLNKFYDRASKGEEIWIRDNRTIDFMIFNEEQENIIGFLKEHGMGHSVLIADVREKVDEALVQTFPARRSAVSGDSFTWKSYPSLHEINDYLNKMAATFPTHCKIITLGKTLHMKPIYMLKISNGDRNNKAILVDSGTHGREWTSVISTLYLIESIVRKFYQQPAFITKRDWHIIPVLNPDGYDYSLTTDHLWRKNRRKISGMCYGVDLNRNFEAPCSIEYDGLQASDDEDASNETSLVKLWYEGTDELTYPHNMYLPVKIITLLACFAVVGYNWGKQGSTLASCSENFCGAVPFSEEETKAFKRLADSKHFDAYLSIHSAGTKVLYPLGAEHNDHHQHILMTKKIALAMRKVDNREFINRDILKMGTNSYGMAMDWMHFVKQIKHSYIIETRGQNGLDVIPSDQILPAAQEVRAGLMKFAEAIK